jgi:hypothetical protein
MDRGYIKVHLLAFSNFSRNFSQEAFKSHACIINVGNNYTKAGPSEESWAFKLVPTQGELATLKSRQQDSWEIDTQTSPPQKSYFQEYTT